MPSPSRQSIGIAALFEQICRAIYENRGPKAIQPSQWSILRYFQRAGEDARTVTGLARYLGITKGPASRALANLEKRGLLVARRHEIDGRIQVYALTQLGRDLVAGDPLRDFAHSISGLSDTERQCLVSALTKLSREYGLTSDF